MSDITPFTGEPLALDLINTRVWSGGQEVDLIETPSGLAAWLALQADRLPQAAVVTADLGQAELAPVHAVREDAAALLRCLRRGESLHAETLDRLNAALAAAPAYRVVTVEGGRPVSTVLRQGPPASRLAADLAEAVVDLITNPAAAKIRDCAAEDCVMQFLPRHPKRQWCAAERCGNRTRVQRYYRRHNTENQD